jgi:hypothetical protein
MKPPQARLKCVNCNYSKAGKDKRKIRKREGGG